MNLEEKTSKNTLKIALQMADYVSELDLLLEKIDVLTDDISSNYFEQIDLKTERGRLIAEYDLKIAKVKADMIRSYMVTVTETVRTLLRLSNDTVKEIREERLKKDI